MKILIISPQNVLPPVDGGKISIFYPLKYLAKNNDVFFAFPLPKQNRDRLNGIINEYRNMGVKPIAFELDTADRARKLILNVFSEMPFKMQKYYDRAFLSLLKDTVRKEKVDVILAHHAHMAKYAIELKKEFNIPIFLREHNLEYEIVDYFYRNEKNFFRKIIAYWQYGKTKSYEVGVWKRFDKVFFISNSNLISACRLKDGFDTDNLIYDGMETGVDNGSIASDMENRSFIFTGSLETFQNHINLYDFINEIWRKFVSDYPDCKLYITGNKPGILEKKLSLTAGDLADLNIIDLGFVDNIEEVIKEKKYFLSPTKVGSGIRLKVLQALALKKVLLVSEIDYNMVSYFKDIENIILFRDYGEFVDKFLMLENDDNLCRDICNNAYRLIEDHLNWNKYVEALEREFCRELNRAKGA